MLDERVDSGSEFYERYLEQRADKDNVSDKGESVGWANFDKAYKPGGGLIFCLQMMTLKRLFNRDLYHCLLLEPIERENECRGTGLGCTGGGALRTRWFGDAPIRRVHIV
jgi:hypothetical protein